MKAFDFLRIAREELRDAVDWYDAQREGLGNEFLSEVERAIDRILAFPNAWPRLSARTRRCRLRRFPYGLLYQVRGERILIIAVMHLHRQPGYWRDREKR